MPSQPPSPNRNSPSVVGEWRSLMALSILGLGRMFASAQNSAEPPLPTSANRDARAAAAAIQAPRDLKPPPPIPTPIPGAAGTVSTEPARPSAGSPIPPQQLGASAQPAPPAFAPAPPSAPSPLPTGFQSKVTSSTSASGQFKVYGKDLATRSPFSVRCDEVADRLRKLLRDDQPWVLPVVVSVRTGTEAKPSGPAVSTSISQITNGGFHLQVTINVRPDLKPSDLDVELTRILIAERILRNHSEITTKRSMVLPEWLLTGVSQAMTFRDRSRPSAVFTAIFRSGKIYSIEEILDAAPGQLDALSRTIYETSCCALVLALLEQPEGSLGMRKFLSLLAVDSRDDRTLLNACFPRLAQSDSSLNKWWSLQLASLATPSVFETLGATQTKKQLADALMIHYETTVDAAPARRIVSSESPAADAPPEPAPEEEKKRSLIGRIFGGASAGDKQSGDEAGATKPTIKSADEEKAEAEAAHEEKKRGIFGRMFGARGSSEESAEASNDGEAKKTEEPPSTKPETKKTPADEKTTDKAKDDKKPTAEDEPPADAKKPGFLGRMFGGGGAKAAEDEAKDTKSEAKKETAPKKNEKPTTEPKESPNDKPKARPTDEPKKTKAEDSEESSEPRKRGFLGRMFGGSGSKESTDAEEKAPKKSDKKSEDKKSDEPSDSGQKKKSADASGGDLLIDSVRMLAALGEEWTGEAVARWAEYFIGSSAGHEVKLRLPFGRKKEESEESKSEDKPSEDKKSGSKPESEAAPKKKPESASKPKAKSKSEPVKQKLVPVSIPLEDYANIMKRKDRVQILEGTINSLQSLQTRANVLFRPIIADYVSLVGDIQNGKTKDMDKRLAELRSRTAKAYERAKAVEDHLDVFEANETKNYSGAFEDYLRLPAQIQKELPVRDDPLSKYLDALDEEFSR